VGVVGFLLAWGNFLERVVDVGCVVVDVVGVVVVVVVDVDVDDVVVVVVVVVVV